MGVIEATFCLYLISWTTYEGTVIRWYLYLCLWCSKCTMDVIDCRRRRIALCPFNLNVNWSSKCSWPAPCAGTVTEQCASAYSLYCVISFSPGWHTRHVDFGCCGRCPAGTTVCNRSGHTTSCRRPPLPQKPPLAQPLCVNPESYRLCHGGEVRLNYRRLCHVQWRKPKSSVRGRVYQREGISAQMHVQSFSLLSIYKLNIRPKKIWTRIPQQISNITCH